MRSFQQRFSIRLAWLFSIACATLISLPLSRAENPVTRIGISGGIGQSRTESAEYLGVIAKEAPVAFGFVLDSLWRDSVILFAEHMRTYGDGSSTIGLTGAGIKYFPWISPAHYRFTSDETNESSFGFNGLAFYLGSSFGVAQASIPASGNFPTAVAVSYYAAGKLGVETMVFRSFGIRGEGNYGISFVGSGKIQQFNFMLGIFQKF